MIDYEVEINPLQAQAEILGTFLTYPDLLQEYKHKLTPELFYAYRSLYQTMVEVEESEGLTFKGVAARLQKPESIKRLHEIKQTFIGVSRMDMLITRARRQLLGDELKRIANDLLNDTEDPDKALRKLQEEAGALFTSDSGKMRRMESQVSEWTNWIKSVAKDPTLIQGMMTGLTGIDVILRGIHKQDFIVIGARTSMGKSAFEIEIALRLASRGYKGAIFSLEMSSGQIYNRMAANLAQYSLDKIMNGDINDYALTNISNASELIQKIYIDDTRGITSDYIVDTMRHIKREQGLDFVIVDYLQDVVEKGEQNDNTGSALARLCRKLRAGAQQCDCAMIGLSQVVRLVEDRDDKRPTPADLSGSTGIETAADVIAMLYRDDYYNPNTEKKDILEVSIAKHRNGKLGRVELHYDKQQQRIYNR